MKLYIVRLFYFIVGLMFLLSSCNKNLNDIKPGNQITYDNIAPSSARVVLAEGLNLKVNETTLTNWLPYDLNLNGIPAVPTRYFINGTTTNPFFVPQEFIDAKGAATVRLYSFGKNASKPDLVDSFLVQDNYYQPKDYYVVASETGKLHHAEVSRTPQPLSNPMNIKVRLLNLGIFKIGSLSLTYADGSLVSSATSHISANASSDYIELPYGTYDFRVGVDSASGAQIHARPPKGVIFNLQSLDNIGIGGGQYYTQPFSFQPGGVYTIAVSFNSGFQYKEYQMSYNTFSIITDNKPTANLQYGKIQIVNSSEPNSVMIQIDGQTPQQLDYTKSTSSTIVSKGKHIVKLITPNGTILTEQQFDIGGGDNVTLWSYADASGKTTLIPVGNNMGGLRQTLFNNDGSDPIDGVYNPYNFNMVTLTRFLNLCPDIPYATFTSDNGILFKEGRFASALAAQNLQPGKPADPTLVPYPYIDLGTGTYNSIQLYQSLPNVVPGYRITEVQPVQPSNFVSLPIAYYPKDKPSMEPGVYTVALVGRKTGDKQPKLIVIKHNK